MLIAVNLTFQMLNAVFLFFSIDEESTRMTDEVIGNHVDGILVENDLNLDGYIDYPEFTSARRTT